MEQGLKNGISKLLYNRTNSDDLMPNITDTLADLAITRSLVLQRVSNGLSNDVASAYQAIIDDISNAIKGADEITLRNMKATIKELKSRIAPDIDYVPDELKELAKVEAGYTIASTNAVIGIDIFSKIPSEKTLEAIYETSLMSGGNGALTIFDWFKSVDLSMQKDIDSSIKLSIINGETNELVAKRLVTRLDMRKRDADRIARTAVSHTNNEARMRTFEANEEVIKGYQRHETLDSATCLHCAKLDAKFYKAGEPKPPATLHIGCRGIYTPVLKSWEELDIQGLDEIAPGTRSSIDGYVSAETSFNSWIKDKSDAYKKSYFGKGRYDLYKSGKITLSQMVGQQGNILTVKQLKEKYS